MTVILIIIAILFFVLTRWSWYSLGKIDKKTKITCIVAGLIIIYVLTFIIFNISKIGINYESQEVMKKIRIIFVLVFTAVNGYVILPYTFRKLEQINNEEIEKQQIQKSIIIILIMVVVLMVIESIYLGNTQQGILDRINND